MWSMSTVVYTDYYIVTGRSPGDAMSYAFELVGILNGLEKMEEVRKTVLF
jgi:hypothetical protein